MITRFMKKGRISIDLIIVPFFLVLIFSCHKKDKKKHVGVYSGVEQYVKIGPYLDTLNDVSKPQEITISLKGSSTFLITKNTYPFSYEVSANKLVKYDSVSVHEGLVPRHNWTIWIDGNMLTGRFEENNGWAGSQDHYLFSGSK